MYLQLTLLYFLFTFKFNYQEKFLKMKTQIFPQYYTNTYWPLQKHIMQRLFWVSLWFMKEVIRYCLLLETGWLVPHCASTEAATARLHGFLFWTLERHGIKCRSNIWKRFLPGVQSENKSVPLIAWPIQFNKEILLLCGDNVYDLNSAKGQYNEWQFQYFLNE